LVLQDQKEKKAKWDFKVHLDQGGYLGQRVPKGMLELQAFQEIPANKVHMVSKESLVGLEMMASKGIQALRVTQVQEEMLAFRDPLENKDLLDHLVDKEIQVYQVIKVTLAHLVHQARLGLQVNKDYPV